MKTSVFKMPNAIITDDRLDYTARKLAAVFYCHRNRLGLYQKSLEGLAKLSHHSIPTIRKDLDTLEKLGYITRQKGYVFDNVLNRPIYAQTKYCCDMSFQGGFTLIRRNALTRKLTPAAFCVVLYIRCQMGNEKRAFPSIKNIGDALTMSRATVCRALNLMKERGLFFVQNVLKRNNAYIENSYYLLNPAAPSQTASSDRWDSGARPPRSQPDGQNNPPGALRRVVARLQSNCRAAARRMQAFFRGGVVSFFAN